MRIISQLPIVLGVLLVAFCTSTVFTSCGESYDFEAFADINEAGWLYADSVNFKARVDDTTQIYNLLLDIKHRKDYPYQNLYIYIHTKLPNGERLGKRLSLDLAEKTGRWHGECDKTTCTVRIDLQKRAYFNQIGDYEFTVKQFMREEPLQGIEQLSLKFKPVSGVEND